MFIIAITLFIVGVQAETQKIEGKVIHQIQREYVQDDPNLKVTLNYGQYETYLQKNGIFQLYINIGNSYNIPNGRYFLQIESRNYIYEGAILDVYQSNKGPSSSVMKIHPILRQRPQHNQPEKQRRVGQKDSMIFEIIQKIDYFEKEEELSLATIYKNQYFFMIALTLVMLFFVKKMPMEEMQSAERAPVQQ